MVKPAVDTATDPQTGGSADRTGRDGEEDRLPEAGRKEGFTEEALPHLDRLYGRALQLTGGDEARSKDLVQTTMLRAYRAWDSYENGTDCKAWLMTILRNAFLNRGSRRSRRPDRVNFEDLAERAPEPTLRTGDPERAFWAERLDADVARAIEELPEQFRTVLVLADLHDRSYPEIASSLDIPLGTVKSRVHRARTRIEDALRDYAREMGMAP